MARMEYIGKREGDGGQNDLLGREAAFARINATRARRSQTGGGGGGAPIPSSSIPGMHGAVPGLPTTTAPLGGIMPESVGMGLNLPDWLGGLLTPKNIVGLGSVLAGLLGGRSNAAAQDSEEMRRIARITEAQMRRADPLHQVAVNLAFGRLPVHYRQGVDLRNVPLPE